MGLASSLSTRNPRLKVIDEDLIKYAWPQDVWFHVDKLSSAHVYIRMSEGMVWDAIPEPLLIDCAQLVKANSIEGMGKRRVPPIGTMNECDQICRKQEG